MPLSIFGITLLLYVRYMHCTVFQWIFWFTVWESCLSSIQVLKYSLHLVSSPTHCVSPCRYQGVCLHAGFSQCECFSFLPLCKPPLRWLISFFFLLALLPSAASVLSFILSFLGSCSVLYCIACVPLAPNALPFFVFWNCWGPIDLCLATGFFLPVCSCILGHPAFFLLGQS